MISNRCHKQLNLRAQFSVFFLVCLMSATSLANETKTYGVYFPYLKQSLASPPGELPDRIEGFDLLVYCGHIESISHVPYDWNIKINRAISTVDRPGVMVEEIMASSGHGASTIPYSDKQGVEELDGIIRVTILYSECFDMSVKFAICGEECDKSVKFAKDKIELR